MGQRQDTPKLFTHETQIQAPRDAPKDALAGHKLSSAGWGYHKGACDSIEGTIEVERRFCCEHRRSTVGETRTPL